MRATGKKKFTTDLFSFNIQKNGGIFVNAVPGSEVGINIASLRAAEKS